MRSALLGFVAVLAACAVAPTSGVAPEQLASGPIGPAAQKSVAAPGAGASAQRSAPPANLSADVAPAPQTPPAPVAAVPAPPRPVLPPATTPSLSERMMPRHNEFLAVAKAGNIDLLFVGDSITDWWRQDQRGKSQWDKTWAPLKAANFGIAGDTTQGVLWRMQNGELDGFKAKLVVLMLGTNNLGRNEIADIAAGDAAIVQEFRKRQPQAKVLILGVFPRGADHAGTFRPMIRELNGHLAKLADNKSVFYLDIGDKFLAPDGSLPADIMPDGLHPNLKGYGIWAAATEARVKELMK